MLDLYNSQVNVQIIQLHGCIQVRLNQVWYNRIFRSADSYYTWQKQISSDPFYGYHGKASELSNKLLTELTLARLEGKIKNL